MYNAIPGHFWGIWTDQGTVRSRNIWTSLVTKTSNAAKACKPMTDLQVITRILAVLGYIVLPIKFQGHQSIGSGEDFFKLWPYMGMAAILVMQPRPFQLLFCLEGSGCFILNMVTTGPVGSEEKSFEIVNGRTDSETYLYYKLPRSLWLKWVIKTSPRS